MLPTSQQTRHAGNKRWPWALLILLAATPAIAQTERTLELAGEIRPPFSLHTIPRWAGGKLVGVENERSRAPIIYTMDRDGRREDFLFTIPDAAYLSLADWTLASNGEIGLVGGASLENGKVTGFVARLAPDRKSQVVTRTFPYFPEVISFAPDGTIWTIGRLETEDRQKVLIRSQLRIFNRSGKTLLSKYVPAGGDDPVGLSYLRSSGDRVGWLANGGEYIEFTHDGQEMLRIEGPKKVSGLAMSKENEVVAGGFQSSEGEFLVLDRSTNTWEPAVIDEEEMPRWAWMLGFDGPDLITTVNSLSLLRFLLN